MSEAKMREDFERKHESFVHEDKQWIMYGYDEGVKACAAIKDAEIAEARKTAEYWKSEHLAGNKEIAALELKNNNLRETLVKIKDYTTDISALTLLVDALAKSEHHNSRALEKMLLEARIDEISQYEDVSTNAFERLRNLKAKLAELNKE